MYRFNYFTEKANHVINLAITSAEELGHNYIGSEHLLLGILKEDAGVGAQCKGECQKAQQRHVGVGQKDADDDGVGEAQFDDGVQTMQQRIARHVVDDVNHGGPSPR